MEITTLHGHTDSITKVIFHPLDDNLILSSSLDNTIRLWNLETNRQEKILEECHDEGLYGVFSLEFKKEDYFVSGGSNGDIICWDFKMWKKIYTLIKHEKIIRHLNFSNDCNYLVSGDIDGKIILWKFSLKRNSFQFNRILFDQQEIYSIAFNDNFLVMTGKDSLIRYL